MTQTIIQEIQEGTNEYEYRLKKDAKYTLVLIALKVKKADIHLIIKLASRGASATIIGLVLGTRSSDIQFHTSQIHEAPSTTSNLLVKSVLPNGAKFIYEGSIRIEKNAQKTDAYQRNENLLTGETAHAQSNPSLEILANDVRCTHGAATSPIPQEELWYLKSRGITEKSAQKLYIEGYMSSAINLVDDVRAKDRLWQKVHSAI